MASDPASDVVFLFPFFIFSQFVGSFLVLFICDELFGCCVCVCVLLPDGLYLPLLLVGV